MLCMYCHRSISVIIVFYVKTTVLSLCIGVFYNIVIPQHFLLYFFCKERSRTLSVSLLGTGLPLHDIQNKFPTLLVFMALKCLKCTINNLHAVLCFQLRKELNGKPLWEALDDQTLPLCWKGKKPFKRIRDIKKYFKPLALSFSNGWRAKSQFEIPPESYLIVSVSPLHHIKYKLSQLLSIEVAM